MLIRILAMKIGMIPLMDREIHHPDWSHVGGYSIVIKTWLRAVFPEVEIDICKDGGNDKVGCIAEYYYQIYREYDCLVITSTVNQRKITKIGDFLKDHGPKGQRPHLL